MTYSAKLELHKRFGRVCLLPDASSSRVLRCAEVVLYDLQHDIWTA